MAEINLPEIKTSSLLWANRPDASSAKGEMFFFSDIGVNGSYWVSNGEFWSPLNGEVTLFSSGLDVSLTGTTTETAIGTYTLQGGIMSRVGQLDVVALVSCTNNANTKTFRVRKADVGSISTGAYYSAAVTSVLNIQLFTCIKSNNSTTAQKGFGSTGGVIPGLGTVAASIITTSRNMSLPCDISVTGQLGNSADTISLRGYYVVYRG